MRTTVALAVLLASSLVDAKVGRIKLAPNGMETSEIGLGGLHLPELESK